jgi:hypothetical protein
MPHDNIGTQGNAGVSRRAPGEKKENKKYPTLFRVKLLKSVFGNDAGDILDIKMVDEHKSIYYFDSFGRWCYFCNGERGRVWEMLN